LPGLVGIEADDAAVNPDNGVVTKILTKTMDIKGPINRSKFQDFDIHINSPKTHGF